jgi:hypothetical protein
LPFKPKSDILLDEKLSQLSDNRDYGVMTDCTPKGLTSIEELSRPSKRANVRCKYYSGYTKVDGTGVNFIFPPLDKLDQDPVSYFENNAQCM